MNIKEKKKDADDFIREVIKKVPAERKAELLAMINGFAFGIENQTTSMPPEPRKAG